MKKESKYYYQKSTIRDWECVIHWRGDYIVELQENVEYEQYIDLSFNKDPKTAFPRPKSSKYEKVRAILKDVYMDYYKLALKLINKNISETGEFYVDKQSKDWYFIYYFSDADSTKKSISIDFRNFMDYMYLTIDSGSNFRSRKGARNNGKAITYSKFMQTLRLILKYLYDPDSYDVLQEHFTKNFHLLVQSDEEVEVPDLMFSTDEALKDITKRITKRKQKIERRLIENDDDSELDRVKLRGELDGLNYALKTLKIHS